MILPKGLLCTLPTQYASIIKILSHYHNTTEVAYCVGKVHNILPRLYYDTGLILWEHIVLVRNTICYLGGIMIMGAYCVGKAHNMLPQYYYYNWSILCR